MANVGKSRENSNGYVYLHLPHVLESKKRPNVKTLLNF